MLERVPGLRPQAYEGPSVMGPHLCRNNHVPLNVISSGDACRSPILTWWPKCDWSSSNCSQEGTFRSCPKACLCDYLIVCLNNTPISCSLPLGCGQKE